MAKFLLLYIVKALFTCIDTVSESSHLTISRDLINRYCVGVSNVGIIQVMLFFQCFSYSTSTLLLVHMYCTLI